MGALERGGWNPLINCWWVIHVVHIEGLSMERGKHCFSFIMYEFCSNNAVYSASLSFTRFIF